MCAARGAVDIEVIAFAVMPSALWMQRADGRGGGSWRQPSAVRRPGSQRRGRYHVPTQCPSWCSWWSDNEDACWVGGQHARTATQHTRYQNIYLRVRFIMVMSECRRHVDILWSEPETERAETVVIASGRFGKCCTFSSGVQAPLHYSI